MYVCGREGVRGEKEREGCVMVVVVVVEVEGPGAALPTLRSSTQRGGQCWRLLRFDPVRGRLVC